MWVAIYSNLLSNVGKKTNLYLNEETARVDLVKENNVPAVVGYCELRSLKQRDMRPPPLCYVTPTTDEEGTIDHRL